MKKPSKITSSSASIIPLDACLAKTWDNHFGNTGHQPGRTVKEHGHIASAVAKRLLELLPDAVRSLYPEYAHIVAAVHDVGKVNPMFIRKIYAAAGQTVPPELSSTDVSLERETGFHWSVSRAALNAILPDNPVVAEIAGWHHGRPCTDLPATHTCFGGTPWQELRRELLLCLNPGWNWPKCATPEQQEILKGLTTVSDWIASGEIFDDPTSAWEPLVNTAVELAGFRTVTVRQGLTFTDIFGKQPRPAQEGLMHMVTGPGVYVLEAPMGMGKTEAALYAAYTMLEQGLASGMYFALPTRLTSDKIHERVAQFLDVLGCGTPLLLHGMAWMQRYGCGMGGDASPGQAWFSRAKRGLLAPFAVGTIDQALMSVISVRHNFVRLYGLAGKVVILDEVHSYDAYTGTLLDRLVATLARLGCTVIILSATLTSKRRSELIGTDTAAQGYPLITALKGGTLEERTYPAPSQNAEVRIRMDITEEAAMEEALLRAEQGEQVLWVENTVAEAQERYRLLAARGASMHVETGLLHSRFTAADRSVNESRWTTLFGKDCANRTERGRILVGTQVVEQSLDIDADFLVTTICPVDMLFQRMGRLWRHALPARAASAVREAWIIGPGIVRSLQEPRTAFGASGYVYSPYVLARTMEQWVKRSTISLPADIRPMLEAVYADRSDEEEGQAMREAFRDMKQEIEKYRCAALSSLDINGFQKTDDNATTRLNERPSASLLLLRRWDVAGKKAVLADGREIQLDIRARAGERANIAEILAANTIHMPVNHHIKELPCISSELRALLSQFIYIAEDTLLKILILRDDGSMQDLSGNQVEAAYTNNIGLSI